MERDLAAEKRKASLYPKNRRVRRSSVNEEKGHAFARTPVSLQPAAPPGPTTSVVAKSRLADRAEREGLKKGRRPGRPGRPGGPEGAGLEVAPAVPIRSSVSPRNGKNLELAPVSSGEIPSPAYVRREPPRGNGGVVHGAAAMSAKSNERGVADLVRGQTQSQPGAFAYCNSSEVLQSPGFLSPIPDESLSYAEADNDSTGRTYSNGLPEKPMAGSDPAVVEPIKQQPKTEEDLEMGRGEKPPKKKMTRQKFCLCLVPIVAAIVGCVVFFVIRGRDSEPAGPPTQSPTKAPTEPPCPEEIDWVDMLDKCSVTDSIRDVIPECLSSVYETVIEQTKLPITFGESCTPPTLARAALSFAVMKNMTGTDDLDLYFHLATLYFSLNGPTDWINRDNWLAYNADPCTWHGVSCDASNSVTMILSANQVGGTLPSEIGLFSSLARFKISQGTLTGTLPTEVCNIRDLSQFVIDTVKLSGTIPTELGNCQNLIALQLRDTSIEGSLPTELGLAQNLKVFDVSSLSLSGTIPQELLDIEGLQRLIINGRVSGSIPPALPPSLDTLILDSTRLTGEIPSEIGGLAQLTRLSIDYSRLNSTLPVELGLLTSLHYLTIARSPIVGTIPTEIGALTVLDQLILSETNLEGNLPTELALCTDLKYVDVTGTQMTGTIPNEMCSLFENGASILSTHLDNAC